MMMIDLASLEGSEHSFDLVIPANDLDLESETVHLKGQVLSCGSVSHNEVETVVSGKIDAVAEIDCSRCLTPVEKKIGIEFEAEYLAPEAFNEAGNRELESTELNADALFGEKLDLREIVREQILLNLPEIVLCSDDCKGLCVKCGSNRNLTSCNCEDKDIDPRWAALKGFK